MSELRGKVIDALNNAKLESSPDARERYLCEVQELIFHQDKTQQLLSEFIESVAEFQTDTGLTVRKFVVSFIEEACKKDIRLLPSLFVHLTRITQDRSTKVQAKAFNAINNLFRRAIWMVITESEDINEDISGPTINTPTSAKDIYDAISSVSHIAEAALVSDGSEAGQELVRVQAAKLLGTIALCYLSDSARDREKKIQKGKMKPLEQRAIDASPEAISALDFPNGHPLLIASELHAKGISIGETLARCLDNRLNDPRLSMVILNVIAILMQHRPPLRGLLLEKLAAMPIGAASKAFRQAMKTHMLKCIKLPSMVQVRPVIIQLLSAVGAEKQAEAVLASLDKSKGKGKRPAAAQDDGSGPTKRQRTVINLSQEVINNMDVEEAIDWVMANISHLPSSRSQAATKDQGSRKGSFDLLLQLLASTQQKRTAKEALASPQVVKRVHEIAFQSVGKMAVDSQKQVDSAFGRIIRSNCFNHKHVWLRNMNSEKSRIIDVVARLACGTIDGHLRHQLMTYVTTSLSHNIDVIIALLYQEYSNEILYRAPQIEVDLPPDSTVTSHDGSAATSGEQADLGLKKEDENLVKEEVETTIEEKSESTTKTEVRGSRYDSFALALLKLVYGSDTAQPYTLKLLRFAPRITPDMFKFVLHMFQPNKPKQVSFALKCLNLLFVTRPVLSDACVDVALYLCFAGDPGIKGQVNNAVVEWYTNKAISSKLHERIHKTAMMGLEASKHGMMPEFVHLQALKEFADGFKTRELVPTTEDVQAAKEVESKKMEVEGGEATKDEEQVEGNESQIQVEMKATPLDVLGTTLFFSLCVVDPALVSHLLKVYSEAKSMGNDSLCTYVIEHIGFVDKIAASSTSSPTQVLRLLNQFPKNSEDLIVAVLKRLTSLISKSYMETADTESSLLAVLKELQGTSDGAYLVDQVPEALVPVAGAISRAELLEEGRLAQLAQLPEEKMVEAMRNILGSSERQLEPAELMFQVAILPSEKCSAKVLVGVIKVLFAESAYYSAEVCAVAMQRLVSQPEIPVILFRIVAQSVLGFPNIKSFVVSEILPRLLDHQGTASKDLWPSILGTIRFVGPSTLGAIVTRDLDKVKAVVAKYPTWKGDLKAMTDNQSISMSSEVREYVQQLE